MREIDLELSAEEVTARIEAMDEDKQMVLRGAVTILLRTLESDDGGAVIMADMNGRGKAVMLVVGNSFIAPQLTHCASDALHQMEDHQGAMQ